MTSSEAYITDLPEAIQEQLFDEGHYDCSDDWPLSGEEMLANMYSDPANVHTDFPCIWLETQVKTRAIDRMSEHWHWDECFRAKDADIWFRADKENLEDAHRVFVERYKLTGKQFLLLQILYDEMRIKIDSQGDAEVDLLDGMAFCDDQGVGVQLDGQDTDEFMDEVFAHDVDGFRLGTRNPMFGDVSVDDLYSLTVDDSAGQNSRATNLFVDDIKNICQTLQLYAQAYLNHVQDALSKEYKYVHSFEYWKETVEANEYTVLIES